MLSNSFLPPSFTSSLSFLFWQTTKQIPLHNNSIAYNFFSHVLFKSEYRAFKIKNTFFHSFVKWHTHIQATDSLFHPSYHWCTSLKMRWKLAFSHLPFLYSKHLPSPSTPPSSSFAFIYAPLFWKPKQHFPIMLRQYKVRVYTQTNVFLYIYGRAFHNNHALSHKFISYQLFGKSVKKDLTNTVTSIKLAMYHTLWCVFLLT